MKWIIKLKHFKLIRTCFYSKLKWGFLKSWLRYNALTFIWQSTPKRGWHITNLIHNKPSILHKNNIIRHISLKTCQHSYQRQHYNIGFNVLNGAEHHQGPNQLNRRHRMQITNTHQSHNFWHRKLAPTAGYL